MRRLALLVLLFLLIVASLGGAVESQNPRLTVRGGYNFPPYSFLDENRNPTGFNIDMVRAVAEVMGLDVEIRLGTWSEVRGDLEGGRIDALVGMVHSEERDRLVDFSLPHSTISNGIFVRKGSTIRSLEDLRGKEIIIPHGDIMHDFAKANMRSSRIIPVETHEDALRLLASGKHDAALAAKMQGLYLAHSFKLTNIETVGPPLESMPYGFAVTEGNAHLLAQLNEGLGILKATGRYEEIYQRWFGVYEQRTLVRDLLKYAVWTLTPLLLLLVIVATWSWTLKRKVALKTRELEEELVERKRAERALRESEERFRSVFETAAAGMMVLSPEHKILQANPAFCDFIGYVEDQLLGLSIEDVTHPDDRERSFQNYQKLLSGQSRTLHYEKRYQHKDGQTVWGQTSASCLIHAGYCVGLVQDITARKEAEEALQHLRNIVDFLPDATFVIDRESKVVAWSRALEEMTGVPGKDILGQGNYAYAYALSGRRRPMLIDLLDHPDPAIEAQYDLLERKGRSIYAEGFVPSLYKGKGAYLWSKASQLFDQEGNRIGAIESLRDTTDRKQAEEDLKEANLELDAFVYTVSHDLRTPLTPIIGYAEFLQETCREKLDPSAMACLAEIEKSGYKMLSLMEDLLALAKVGRIERPAEPVDARTVVAEVMENLAEEIARQGVQLECEPLPSLRVPRTFLVQLFDNLISNALRYAGGEGQTIIVGGGRKGERVTFFVRDQGPGIPAEERERIFEVFFRGSVGKGFRGTGIGLATVQKIARAYGGRAWVEQTPGGGSTFWVKMVDVPTAVENKKDIH